MKSLQKVLILLPLLLNPDVGFSHHSFAPLYDAAKTVRLEGKLVSFSFRSPHSVVIMDSIDESGASQRWTIEWGNANVLSGRGITRSFFKPGDKVVITGFPGRNPDAHLAVMRSFLRTTDGFAWGDLEGEKVE